VWLAVILAFILGVPMLNSTTSFNAITSIGQQRGTASSHLALSLGGWQLTVPGTAAAALVYVHGAARHVGAWR
jgi:hypothetical protein